MSSDDFDPPLRVRGSGLVIRTLDQAEHFLHERGEGRTHNQQGLLRRLQLAAAPDDRRFAGNAFRDWLQAEGLLERPLPARADPPQG